MKESGIIYCYTNLINGKMYIGQTWHEEKRKSQHKRAGENPNDRSHNSPFHLAIAKYGFQNFHYSVLEKEITSQEILDELESYYIAYYHTQISEDGYNMTSGGFGHWSASPESKRKMCLAKGKMTEEEVIRLRIAYKNHESPTKIYEKEYKDRYHFNAFLNIWTGQRYRHILPEYIETGRRTKYDEEIVAKIRSDYATGNFTYAQLGIRYNIPEGTIGNIVGQVTHKNKPKNL